MLGKLVKYDLAWINKSLSIFFIISLIVSSLTRISNLFTNSFVGEIIHSILRGATIGSIIALIINCAIRIWARLRNNFYKDESYLTHTLPVNKSTLYDSKIVSAIITLMISLIVVIITILIAYLDSDMINKIKNIFNNSDATFIFISLILSFILELFYMALCGFLGIIIGHRSNNGKLATSVVIGIILYFAIQTVMVVIMFAFSFINGDVNMLFTNNNNLVPDAHFSSGVKLLTVIANSIYALFVIAMYIIGKKIFNKGVNVE